MNLLHDQLYKSCMHVSQEGVMFAYMYAIYYIYSLYFSIDRYSYWVSIYTYLLGNIISIPGYIKLKTYFYPHIRKQLYTNRH